MGRKLFCEYGPLCYAISLKKEWLLRDLKDTFQKEHFASFQKKEGLSHIVKCHRSLLLRHLEGVDMVLQENKKQNLANAAARMDGLVIRPGETFSFWQLIGNPTLKRGFVEGMVIIGNGKPSAAVGGGLCQLANLVHWMVLQSPLTVTELHHHSDALFPDDHRRVPFGTGTSVFYKNVDYRFKNETSDSFQLRVWLDEADLCGELRCDRELSLRWRIEERDHHYSRETDGLYRNSEIWKKTIDRSTGGMIEESLIFRNHSKVLYEESFVPKEEIR